MDQFLEYFGTFWDVLNVFEISWNTLEYFALFWSIWKTIEFFGIFLRGISCY